MKIVNGKYNEAVVFTDQAEDSALSQIRSLCDQEYVAGSRIRIMPDCHAGAGCTVGTTMTITDKVVPNLVGVDIGCGMEVVKISQKHLELQKLDKVIQAKIPSGFQIRDTPHPLAEEAELEKLRCLEKANINISRAQRSIGTLGGGNHFIEVDADEEGSLYVVIHTGSRHLGVEVAQYYQELGWRELNGQGDEAVSRLIEEYKAAGREKETKKALKELKNQRLTEIPRSLAYVTGRTFDDYLHDMKIVQQFADFNRQAIFSTLKKEMKLRIVDRFTCTHNYLDTENMILRKGAVSARRGEKLVIPINMRDGSLLCVGKGNADWNHSAPHGAGRLMSRADAKNSFTLSEFKKQMKGVYSTSVRKDTLDECPMAYKRMEDIVENIADTAEILRVIRPIYNFKAGEE